LCEGKKDLRGDKSVPLHEQICTVGAKPYLALFFFILAGGYDICLVETVGVGQSETMVADIVDM
jgi:putative protein kinase ArgK-like GTPase of G3E family